MARIISVSFGVINDETQEENQADERYVYEDLFDEDGDIEVDPYEFGQEILEVLYELGRGLEDRG